MKTYWVYTTSAGIRYAFEDEQPHKHLHEGLQVVDKKAYDEVMSALEKILTCQGFLIHQNVKDAIVIYNRHREKNWESDGELAKEIEERKAELEAVIEAPVETPPPQTGDENGSD